jgi:D-arabinose 1-dehydrogenase-like Zn-dependent alcohol dehydrogenase
MSDVFGGLAPRGRMIVAGAPKTALEISPLLLIFGSRSLEGTLTGTPIENEETLAFSVLENVRPMIETVPLEKAAEDYQRMASNKARFRVVITMT